MKVIVVKTKVIVSDLNGETLNSKVDPCVKSGKKGDSTFGAMHKISKIKRGSLNLALQLASKKFIETMNKIVTPG